MRTAIGIVIVMILALFGASEFNGYFNNKTVLTPGHNTFSTSLGMSGHIEFTRYEDGSQDVKVYSRWGHRLYDSQLDQDLDGDGQVDRIRRSSGEIKANSLAVILVRKYDYANNQDMFQEADSRLQKLVKQNVSQAVR